MRYFTDIQYVKGLVRFRYLTFDWSTIPFRKLFIIISIHFLQTLKDRMDQSKVRRNLTSHCAAFWNSFAISHLPINSSVYNSLKPISFLIISFEKKNTQCNKLAFSTLFYWDLLATFLLEVATSLTSTQPNFFAPHKAFFPCSCAFLSKRARHFSQHKVDTDWLTPKIHQIWAIYRK